MYRPTARLEKVPLYRKMYILSSYFRYNIIALGLSGKIPLLVETVLEERNLHDCMMHYRNTEETSVCQSDISTREEKLRGSVGL